MFNLNFKEKMKKFIFMMFMAFTVIVANAQTAVQTSKVFDNVYVGAGAGLSAPLTLNGVTPLNTTVTLRVGKQFTPVWGAEIEGTAWLGSHADHKSRFDGPSPFGGHNTVRGTYVGVNGTTNLSNLIWGYKGSPRFIEVSTVLGSGWIHNYAPNNSDAHTNGLGVNTGVEVAFNLGKTKAHTVTVRPAVLWDVTSPDNEFALSFDKNYAQLYLGVGYIYHFKTSNGTHHFKVYDVGALNDEINSLRAELAKKPTEVVVEKVLEKKNVVTVNSEYVVFFAKNSNELTADAKATLDNVEGTVNVSAYASPEGTDEYNKALSQRRADVVAEYLRNRGVTVTEANGYGVNGKTSNRVAIVNVQ